VAAAAEHGKANRAVIDLLTGQLRIGGAQLTMISGSTSSRKVVRITGCTEMQVAAALGLSMKPG
jgi:uncharacterized protein YggU (UPF0235/DUF167 family)